MVDNNLITDLIYKSQSGDENAFNQLYSLTSLILIDKVKNIISQKELCDDVVQDTYLKLLQSKMKSNENGLAYLITIARNIAINTYNKQKKEILYPFEEFEELYSLKNTEVNNLNIIDLMQKYLTSYQKSLIEMHIFIGLTHVEIAHKLNKPVGTIMWQYNEALKVLRKQINKNDCE